jgi:hypothetical protein
MVLKKVIVGGYEAYKTAELLQIINCPFKRVHEMPEHADDDVDLPYKMAKLLTDKGISRVRK